MFVTLSTEWVTQGFDLNVRRRLECARHVGCTYDSVQNPFPVSGHVRPRLEKLRHSASVRLTCMHHAGKQTLLRGAEREEEPLETTTNGLPHGSVGILAPVLCNIYTNDQPIHADTRSFIYADDLCIACKETTSTTFKPPPWPSG